MQKYRLTSVALLAQFAISAFAAPFTPGNIVVCRVGDGSAALSSAATAVFLDEYTPSGTLVQTIAMPVAASGNNRAITNSGTATSEGFISLSGDKSGMTIVGYDAIPGTTGVVGSAVLTINRVCGFVKADGTVDTSTNITDAYDANNIRSGVSIDGTSFWTAGPAPSGVRYMLGGPGQISTQISATQTNTRVVRVFNGQLYVTTGAGSNKGVNNFTNALPTTSGETMNLLAGFSATVGNATSSPYEFYFADANTLYVADDRTPANGGGLQKYTFDGTNWNLAYTINAGLAGTTTIRGLVVAPDAGGNVVYATTTESNANFLVKLVDTGAGSTFSAIATAPALTRFRGLSWTPEAAGGPTTETLAPTAEQIVFGTTNSGGNLASWAADDADGRKVCRFFIPNAQIMTRMRLTYSTTKVAPYTGISFDVKISAHTPVVQLVTLRVENKVTNLFVDTNVVLANIVDGSTYNGVPTGTLADYVGAGGAMRGEIDIRQTGISALSFPCTTFEFGQMVVTGN